MNVFVLSGLFLFGVFSTFANEIGYYFFRIEAAQNNYQGVIKISNYINARNWENTTILTSSNQPGIYYLIYVCTKGRYPIITIDESNSNNSLYNIIETNNVTDIFITDWVYPSINYLYNYFNNSHFILTQTFVDNVLNYGLKNSSLLTVIPW